MPRDKEYHGHIYWATTEQRETAMWLRPLLNSIDCRLGNVHDRPIGPHPLPMYQIEYSGTNQAVIENFLRQNCRNLTVLLHEVSGDDIRDHTDGARWIGKPLELDLEFLRSHSN